MTPAEQVAAQLAQRRLVRARKHLFECERLLAVVPHNGRALGLIAGARESLRALGELLPTRQPPERAL